MSENCRICGNLQDNQIHTAREMMFGTRDEFDYLECGRCGTLQIVEIPDLSRYYPPEYYSLDTDAEIEIAKKLKRRIAARLASKYLFTGHGRLGKFIVDQWKDVELHFPKWLRKSHLPIRFGSRILDFGCGTGSLLRKMRLFGFSDLTGADAFIDGDIHYPEGVNIYKRTLDELEPAFDLIMLHHSFEHLPDPTTVLPAIHRLLDPEGICLIRIPLASFAWNKYGIDWVQLDPPRHLFLYTEQSFRGLAESSGFTVESVIYDSDEFQFFASEQYARDIAMNDPRAFRGVVSESIFSSAELRNWHKQANELNAAGLGDQACFYLKRK